VEDVTLFDVVDAKVLEGSTTTLFSVAITFFSPQALKDPDQSKHASASAEPSSAKKVEKAVQIGDALAEAVEKLDCGEEQKEEITRKA